ncbi:MAG: ABC transporter ATP-binding protein [Chloroflexia bacterium]|nr:ABC transporter ATP-binding protein [Chloroflexia bacterium]
MVDTGHASSDNSVIVTKGLTKRYGDVRALSDVTLSISRGVIFGFLGPNGAGKTTAIRILMGFLRASAGSANVLGHDVWSNGVAVRRNVGYLVTADALYPDMAGSAQLDFAARLSGRSPRLRERVREAVELDEASLQRRLGTYSKGMRQKLAIIAALQHDPELLILDEPTDGLDPLIQRNFEALLRELRDRGTTVFMSSHDLAEVERTCERVAVVRRGGLVANETVADLKRRYHQVATVRFAGDVPSGLTAIPDVQLVGREDGVVHLSLGQDVNALLRFLATTDVRDFSLQPPRLQDVFMDFYDTDDIPADRRGAKERPL